MMKFNSQNSLKKSSPLILAQYGPPYDPADRCAAVVDLNRKALVYGVSLPSPQNVSKKGKNHVINTYNDLYDLNN